MKTDHHYLKFSLVYGGFIASVAALLQWLDFRYHVHMLGTEPYIVIVTITFLALGVWIGVQLRPTQRSLPLSTPSSELRAMQDLPVADPESPALLVSVTAKEIGVTAKESQVLNLLAKGHTNKQIAAHLHIAPSTVKTHLLHLYQKLEVTNRTQALRRAQQLNILPK